MLHLFLFGEKVKREVMDEIKSEEEENMVPQEKRDMLSLVS